MTNTQSYIAKERGDHMMGWLKLNWLIFVAFMKCSSCYLVLGKRDAG